MDIFLTTYLKINSTWTQELKCERQNYKHFLKKIQKQYLCDLRARNDLTIYYIYNSIGKEFKNSHLLELRSLSKNTIKQGGKSANPEKVFPTHN